MVSASGLCGVPIVITEKLDGSNMAMTRSSLFARSHSGPPSHPSFAWAKALHARICSHIENEITLFGEYCYAVHSIVYGALPDYFFLFGVRDDTTDMWWEWDLVAAQAELLQVPTAPVLFRGVCETVDELERRTLALAAQSSCYGGEREGLVVRAGAGFGDSEFVDLVGKYVRPDHVQTGEHWMFQAIRVQRGPAVAEPR